MKTGSRVGGGDGFLIRIDPDDPDQIYYESQNGSMGRTHLKTMAGGRMRPGSGNRSERVAGAGARGARGGGRQRYRFNWETPFILSHHNSKIYYCAGNHVFRSLKKGDDLKQISPNITRGERGSGTALTESPVDPDVLYVGTDDGALWMTRNGGAEWVDLWPDKSDVGEDAGDGDRGVRRRGPSAALADGPRPLNELVPGPRWVTGLECSKFKAGRCYLALDGHRSDDDDPYVFVTEDYGKTWTSLRANLPRGSTRVIREDIENENVLYCGTEFHLWASIDRGKSWTRINNNLPTVAVHEIAQHELSGEILAGTHGRSIWVLDATPLRQMSEATIAADAHLYEPNDVVAWRTLHRRAGTNRRFQGENPPSDAQIYYSLGKDAGSVKISILAGGETIRELSGDDDQPLPNTKGVHHVAWNLAKKAPPLTDRQRDMLARYGSRARRFLRNRGQPADFGTYTVKLEVDGKEFTRTFELQPDPNFPDAPRTAQRRFEDR